ncbi:DUF3102 domain-containing protein [Devosia psychrophila]|uniref:DUF3102 domain-containing protein n=1 Tax=Devosia psychrophila TaxID=728005 RepID=A0A0F5Q1R7_9HYPH|nr:DUF3102 domain-containing protein [Devosia psychrophila]KKC34848.1 hypothetical protein WH91_01085 [Devosia psychrophila]SFC10507.1 Protein of unknown function [Devosia psychrophila]
MLTMSAKTSLIHVINLPFLATEVNDAHHQVTFHARSMLLEAGRAGDALIAAKKLVKHGEFKSWVEVHCRCSYPRAAKYMQVARLTKSIDPDTFEGGIDSFLEANATPRKPSPTPAKPAMDQTDAEYVLKLQAMVVRATPNESAIASNKLAGWAKDAFGISAEEAVATAEALLPDAHLSSFQVAAERVAAEAVTKLQATEERLTALEAQLQQMLTRKAELRAEFSAHSRTELIEMLADAYVQLEQP